MSRTASERTCRGKHHSIGERGGGARKGTDRVSLVWGARPQPVTPAKYSTTTTNIKYTTGRKENTHSLATKAVKGLTTAHNYNTRVGNKDSARLHGHNSTVGKTLKWETKDDSTRTGCPLGLLKTHQAARQETIAVLLQAVKCSTPLNLPLQGGG